jgi:hypothetical protein
MGCVVALARITPGEKAGSTTVTFERLMLVYWAPDAALHMALVCERRAEGVEAALA